MIDRKKSHKREILFRHPFGAYEDYEGSREGTLHELEGRAYNASILTICFELGV
jgi:hypothetical protein